MEQYSEVFPFERFILEPIEKNLNRRSNAFCINSVYYTYSQLRSEIFSIRRCISVEKTTNQILGLVINDDIHTYASIIALWMEGKAYVPLHPDQPFERNMGIAEQVGLTHVIDIADKSRYASKYKVINPAAASRNVGLDRMQAVAAQDTLPAYILFTSGSTGIPKGVPISRGNLAAFVAAFWDMGYQLGPDDRFLQCFNLTFDLSVVSYLIPLIVGGCAYTVPYNVVKYAYICKLMEQYKLTFALMTPSTVQYLKPYFEELSFPDMRYSLFCGEALPLDAVDGWAQCLPNAVIDNVYGPTEDTIFCTWYRYRRGMTNKEHNGILSIGKSMSSGSVTVVDDKNLVVAAGEVGELCLSGLQLTQGYWNNPQKDKDVFWFDENGTRFYRTGDLCFYDSDGDIEFVGRKDAQVKIQGYRVELGEIEVVAKEYFKGECMLLAMSFENSDKLTEIAIFVERNNDCSKELESFLRSKLPAYMIPSKYLFLEKFPVNKSDKIDRSKLKQLL